MTHDQTAPIDRADEDGPQAVWEHAVAEALVAQGLDPRKVEVEVEGFGQDFAEYQDDVDGFVEAVLDQIGAERLNQLRLGS